MAKLAPAPDVLTNAIKQTLFDRIAHNGVILCSTKGCLNSATRTMFFVSGRVTKYCDHHNESGFFPVYAIANHGTIYGDKSKAFR